MKDYDRIEDKWCGISRVLLNSKWGFIDINDNEICECKYDNAWNFRFEFAQVYLNGKYGFINKQGIEICECKYNLVNDFNYGIAWIQLNNKWGFIDENGNELCTPKYKSDWRFSDFEDGFKIVKLKNHKYGVINKLGIEVIPCIYNEDDIESVLEKYKINQNRIEKLKTIL